MVSPSPAPPASISSSSVSSPLSNSATDDVPLDTSILGEVAKTNLIEALNDISGAKTLVLDPSLAGPLGLVTDVSLLKHQAVDKMFWLEAGPLTVATKNIVWMCRPKISWMKVIADQIKGHARLPSPPSHTYTLLLVPRATELCRRVLEEEGVLGDVLIKEYNLAFIPLEVDVLSLEMEHAAREIFLEGDETSIFYSAQALHLVQKAFGVIPRIVGKGDAAKSLSNQLQTLRQTDSSSSPLPLSTQIDAMIVLDRSVDWVTPMCTQLTYEGLIDEIMGIKNSHVEVSPTLLNANPAPTPAATPPLSGATPSTTTPAVKKKKHPLNSSDKVFGELRDLNFAVVGGRLNKIAKRIEGAYNQGRHGKDIAQIKDFVGKLGSLQSEHQALKLHTGLSEEIMAFTRTDEFNKPLEIQQNLVSGYEISSQLAAIEDLISQGAPMNTVLRLLILLSVVAGGLKQKTYDSVRREFLQTYGYHHLPLLLSLSRLSLFNKPPTPSATIFPSLRKPLRLIVDDVDESAPNDISYVYSGYAPVSVRLVQCVAQKASLVGTPTPVVVAGGEGGGGGGAAGGVLMPRAHPIVGWKGFEDVLATIPGATFDDIQTVEGSDAASRVNGRLPKDHVSTTIVFFLGGCTFTEIAALRKMKEGSKGRRFLICTTSIISGNSLLDSLAGTPPVPLVSA
ncbi:vacuolar protein sorting 33A [Mrakia frigida]|uniref:tethering complex ATP-binding subunit VPS33 n=1 Tax=Mrakia frigida TaxID=29902 RepID=UPI003FCC00B2